MDKLKDPVAVKIGTAFFDGKLYVDLNILDPNKIDEMPEETEIHSEVAIVKDKDRLYILIELARKLDPKLGPILDTLEKMAMIKIGQSDN